MLLIQEDVGEHVQTCVCRLVCVFVCVSVFATSGHLCNGFRQS